MSIRREANGSWSEQIKRAKAQIARDTGISTANLSLDMLVRLADKQGFQVEISCVKMVMQND